MRIVILINQAQQDLLPEIAQSRIKHWLKNSKVETLEYSDVWSKLARALSWSSENSLARTMADKQDIKGHCLIATPVKVVLGMRDSESHLLSANDSILTELQLNSFNEFFTGIFRLHQEKNFHCLLEFVDVPEFNLEPHYWPPFLGDYRVQVQAAQGELVKHLTELQAWCYQQDSIWNALYLWSTCGQLPIPPVLVDDRTEHKVFSLLELLNTGNHDADQIIAVDNLKELDTILHALEAKCQAGVVEKIIFSFTDKEIYTLDSLALKPWWKRFSKKNS